MIARKRVAIIGVGLIGGSLALRLHEKKLASHIIGVDNSPNHLQTATELELIDEILPLEKAVPAADVIILAIPVDALTKVAPKVLDLVTNQIVIDLGSTKTSVVEAIKKHPNRKRYLATHPMWGTEYSGPQAAVAGAYTDKAVILCNVHETDEDVLEWTSAMFSKIGMRLLKMQAGAHDLHAAYVSHISHITSFALANTVLEKEKQDNAIFAMASAGFESTVRLAKSNANMWVPIFLQNKENVLDVLTEHIQQLKRFQECIEKDDAVRLRMLIEDANKIRKIIK